MDTIQPEISGRALINGSTLSRNTKWQYVTDWHRWEKHCEYLGVDPLAAAPRHVVAYITAISHLTAKALGHHCSVINKVYDLSGRPSPARDPSVLDKRHVIHPLQPRTNPTNPISNRTILKHALWNARFFDWCETHEKPSLPVKPDALVEFLREVNEEYSYGSMRNAMGAVSRYHRENGQPDPSHYPEVRDLVKELEQHCVPRLEQTPRYGQFPETRRIRKIHQDDWRSWCSQRGIEPMLATSDDLYQYLQEQKTEQRARYLLDRLSCISRMYDSENDPANCDRIREVRAELRDRLNQELVEPKTDRRRRKTPVPVNNIPHVATIDEIPPGLTGEDIELIMDTQAATKAPETLRRFQTSWDPFEQWLGEIGVPVLHVAPLHVSAFICILAKIHPHNVVANSLGAIRYYYKYKRSDDNPADHPYVLETMDGIRRKYPHAPSQMSPIREYEYDRIIEVAQEKQGWESRKDAILRGAFDITAVGFMRDGMLRLVEAAAARWEHLTRTPRGTGSLLIPKSKTDPYGRTAVVHISETTMDALDTFRDTRRSAGKDLSKKDGRIFQAEAGTIYKHIKQVCELALLEGRYGGHSPRIGMAQDLAASGTSLLAIMQAGRWENPLMPAYYIRNIALEDGAVAQWHQRNQPNAGVQRRPISAYGLAPPYRGARFGT